MSACPRPQINPSLSNRLFEIEDEHLVPLAQSGDAVAFVELVRRHVDKIKSQVNHIMRNREDTDDVFQEAIIRAFVHIRCFEGRSSFSTWLTRIAINSALMRLRRKHGIAISLDSALDGSERRTLPEPVDGRDTPEEDLIRREREELVNQAILRLPPKLRVVVEMRKINDSSSKDIAKQLGISVPAVKSRLTRARQLLRITIAKC